MTDLDASVGFYTALGLDCTSRTEIPQAFEAIVENPAGGSKLQLARQKDHEGALDLGTAFWKLYVNTHDLAATFEAASAAGRRWSRPPERLDRWPVTVAFVRDPDGYLVELVERHPWPEGAQTRSGSASTASTSPTSRPRSPSTSAGARLHQPHRHRRGAGGHRREPGRGGKLQLAQQRAQDGPLRMGSMWKLYVTTDDCEGLHRRAVDAGHPSLVSPMRLDRWHATIAFVGDPDGYQVELVQRHGD